MLEFVEHLFTYQFLNRALITSIIVGIVCGTVGSLIVLRGLSLMGDAMSHAVLPGVALSFLFGIPMFVGALITGMIASIFIGYITSSSKTKPDAAIGISFTAFLASGIIIISLINTTTDLYHILFGNLLAITNSAFLTTIVIGSIVLILIIIFYRPLMISTFDPTFSRMSGLNTTLLHYFVMLLLSLVTVAKYSNGRYYSCSCIINYTCIYSILISKKTILNDDYSKFNKCHKFNCRTLLQLYLQHS